MAACPDLPREPVSVQPWTVSLHLPTVAARLAATDPEVLLLGDREGPGLHLGRGLEVPSASLPSPVDRDILEGLQFTRADRADVWTAVHRRLPDSWPQVFRPPGHERLVGVEWRVWATNSPCPPVVVLPRRTSHPSWETVAVLWGWVAVRGTGGHVFTAPLGTVMDTDRGMALQLTAEPLTTHVVVAVLQGGADKPQRWRDPVTRAVWRDLPVLRAAVWPGGAGRHLPGALPWLRDCGDASSPPAELRGALEHLYSKPRHHFLVAADHGMELSDEVVALAADVVHCLAPHAMLLPRKGWEGQRHNQNRAALLIARYVKLGSSEAVYLDRFETPSMHLDGSPPPGPCHAVDSGSARPACGVGGPVPVAAHLGHGGPDDAQGTQGPEGGVAGCGASAGDGTGGTGAAACGNNKDCGVCALMSTVGTLLRVPRPGNISSALDRRWVAAVVLNRDMGPIARLPSPRGSCPQRCWMPCRPPAHPWTWRTSRTAWGCPGRACNMLCCVWRRQRTGGCPCS